MNPDSGRRSFFGGVGDSRLPNWGPARQGLPPDRWGEAPAKPTARVPQRGDPGPHNRAGVVSSTSAS
jgi:hypothetical protein